MLKRLFAGLNLNPIAKAIRDDFGIEPLEQRLLLSGDPLLTPAAVAAPNDEPEQPAERVEYKADQSEVQEESSLELDIADLDAETTTPTLRVAEDETLGGSQASNVTVDAALDESGQA
ncbi:LEPR-XLL domain-containing protein, partial [Spiribacter sp. C176]